MDSKMARRTHRQLSPKLEDRAFCNGKVAASNSYAATPGKNTSVPTLPPALPRDCKYPSLDSVHSSLAKNSVRDESASRKKISRSFQPSKMSPSVEGSDVYLQKRPVKLAPLNLPQEVREAQLKKMNDKVYLAKKSYKPIDKTMKAIYDPPIIRDALNKVGTAEKNPEEVTVENISPKDEKGDCKAHVVQLSGNSRERMPSSSTIRVKSGHVYNSCPKIVNMDSAGDPVKGRLNHTKCHSTNHSISKSGQGNRLTID